MEENNIEKPVAEHHSLTDLLTEGLGKENAQALENFFAEFRQHLQAGAEYVEENPREALIVAASAGLAAWVLFATKPGRRIFTPAVIAFLPSIKNWLSETFGAKSEDKATSSATTPSLQHH